MLSVEMSHKDPRKWTSPTIWWTKIESSTDYNVFAFRHSIPHVTLSQKSRRSTGSPILLLRIRSYSKKAQWWHKRQDIIRSKVVSPRTMHQIDERLLVDITRPFVWCWETFCRQIRRWIWCWISYSSTNLSTEVTKHQTTEPPRVS